MFTRPWEDKSKRRESKGSERNLGGRPRKETQDENQNTVRKNGSEEEGDREKRRRCGEGEGDREKKRCGEGGGGGNRENKRRSGEEGGGDRDMGCEEEQDNVRRSDEEEGCERREEGGGGRENTRRSDEKGGGDGGGGSDGEGGSGEEGGSDEDYIPARKRFRRLENQDPPDPDNGFVWAQVPTDLLRRSTSLATRLDNSTRDHWAWCTGFYELCGINSNLMEGSISSAFR